MRKKRSKSRVVLHKDHRTPYLMLTMLVVVAVGVVYLFFAQPYSTGRAVSNICTDSDGGLNYYVYGVVNAKGIVYRDSCAGNSVYEKYCYLNYARSRTYTCPSGCTGGACVSAVVNQTHTECLSGYCATVSGQGVSQCLPVGSYCGTNQTCSNDCSYSGQRACTTMSSYITCGNYDSDACLEWNYNATFCPSNFTCSNGDCLQPTACTNECPVSGQRQCYGAYCTTAYNVKCKTHRVCGNYDADSCREWSPLQTCAGSCYQNKCIGI